LEIFSVTHKIEWTNDYKINLFDVVIKSLGVQYQSKMKIVFCFNLILGNNSNMRLLKICVLESSNSDRREIKREET
jgi:hypothetical protein